MKMRYTQTIRTSGKEEIRQIDIEDMEEDKAGEILLQLMEQSIINVETAEVDYNYDEVVFSEAEVADDKIVPIESKRPQNPTPPSSEDVGDMAEEELIEIALDNHTMRRNHDGQLSLRTFVTCPECDSVYYGTALEWFKFIKCKHCGTELRLEQTNLFSKYIANDDGNHFTAKEYK